MKDTGRAVSKDLAKLLDQISGIPRGKEERAGILQKRALAGSGTGPADPLGMWWGGCYYTRSSRGRKGRSGTWKLQYCVA